MKYHNIPSADGIPEGFYVLKEDVKELELDGKRSAVPIKVKSRGKTARIYLERKATLTEK